jgi:hypothetical protein
MFFSLSPLAASPRKRPQAGRGDRTRDAPE